jgi:hypothetical protein
LRHDLILLGSPATVITKRKAWATAGMFNTFFGGDGSGTRGAR